MGDNADMCATACALLSAVAVPLLFYFGLLAFTRSPLLEIPEANKGDAAWGCWTAAVMYAGTFIYCWFYKMKKNRCHTARQAQGYQMQKMDVM